MTVPVDRFEAARAVADATLYEGYVLYPYRASSRKNQVRFQWGVLMPPAVSASDPSERSSTRTECLVAPDVTPVLSIRVRFLQTQRRRVETVTPAGDFVAVPFLEVDGTLLVEWDEAIEHVVDVEAGAIGRNGGEVGETTFTVAGGVTTEALVDAGGATVGRFVRRREVLHGVVNTASARAVSGAPYLKVCVEVRNTTPTATPGPRGDAMPHSLVAVHTMLAVDGGRFVSLLDPGVAAAEAAASCRSEGCYPILIGDEDVVLASPIILYDHPEVAAQSPGDLYDSLEIDEILALRVMTMTDEEKAEARSTDLRAAAIIDRCDALSSETMGRLHGQMRPVEGFSAPRREEEGAVPWWDPASDASVDPWSDSVWIGHAEVREGVAVRLHPSRARRCPRHVRRRTHGDRGRGLSRCRRRHPRGGVARRRPRNRRAPVAGTVPVLPFRRGRTVVGPRGDAVSDVLVAGIGNVFQRDDAFGVEVAQRLAAGDVPPGTQVSDFGIRGVHLAYELLEGYRALVLVDAVPMGEPPGTLAVIEPQVEPISDPSGGTPALDAHTMSPDVVLAILSRLGGSLERVYVVGCQPADLREGMGLTPAVEAAVDGAVDLCLELLAVAIAEPVGKGNLS